MNNRLLSFFLFIFLQTIYFPLHKDKFISIFRFLNIFTNYRDKERNKDMRKSNIIFDIDGVLFKENKLKIAFKSGLLKLLRYILTHRKNPFKLGLEIFHKMHLEEKNDTISTKYKNYTMPKCISEWMKGKLSNKALIQKIDRFIEKLKIMNYFSSSYEKNLIQKLIKILLNENQIPNLIKPINPMIKLVNTLKKEGGYRLFILSNYAKEASDILIEQYKEFFSLFDDIIISANIGMIKPEKEIYEHLLSKHSLKPEECIFIDDQEINIQSAQNIGITGVLYKNHENFESSLQRLDILNRRIQSKRREN